MIKITVWAANNTQYETSVSTNLTGYQLKQHIHQKVCNSLAVSEMALLYAGVRIANQKKLSQYKIVEKGATMKIVQTKVSLTEVSNIIVAYQIDQISLQETTARMPCGHVIGRDCMTGFIRSLISAKKYEIRCPSQKPDATDCLCQWEFKQCRKVGVFTKQQVLEFEEGLSKNWMQKFTSDCPSCKHPVCKGQLQSNRVICPNCKYGDFCFSCLKKWRTNNMDLCGNQQCQFVNQFLKNCPWDKPFKLKTKEGTIKECLTPRYRACPNCHIAIEHKQACKHMVCSECKKGFCWVCLAVSDKGIYPCGTYTDYCGKIAQVQQINI